MIGTCTHTRTSSLAAHRQISGGILFLFLFLFFYFTRSTKAHFWRNFTEDYLFTAKTRTRRRPADRHIDTKTQKHKNTTHKQTNTHGIHNIRGQLFAQDVLTSIFAQDVLSNMITRLHVANVSKCSRNITHPACKQIKINKCADSRRRSTT